ncbi:MAG: DNA polymerase III subunit gamma/tau [Planctomycetota bacterium]
MSANESSGESYVVVARRYRPKGFDELVGQSHVGQALKNAIETSRVGHAYLFTGARGVGKTSTARIFAKALNDPGGPTTTPDLSTDVAQSIDAGEDVDVIEIDGASNRGIDEIRSLRANVNVRPSRSRYKIYIIDEVHMLTGPAFNALLKTLEEPPEHVKFIFCTTDPEKIPITVLSRCQRFDFAPVDVAKIVGRLQFIVDSENASADREALELIARRAAGSMRDSQSLLEQVLSFSDGTLTADAVHAMLGTADDERLHRLASAMADRNAVEVLRQIDDAIDAGVDAGRLAEQLLGYFRDLMTSAVGGDESLMRHTSVSMQPNIRELAERWGLQTVLAVVSMIDQTLVRIRLSVYPRVLLETTLIQIANLPDLQTLSDLVAAAGDPSATPSEKKKQVAAPPPSSADAVRSAAQTQSVTQPVQPVAQPASHSKPAIAADPEADQGAAPSSNGQAPPSPDRIGNVVQTNPAAVEVPDNIEDLWLAVRNLLEDMTATFAGNVSKVRQIEKKIVLTLPAEASLARRRLEQTEHASAILSAFQRHQPDIRTIEFESAKPIAKSVSPSEKPRGPSRSQLMKEIENDELVQAVVDMLGGSIVRIEKKSS